MQNSSYILVTSEAGTYPVTVAGLRLGRAPDCDIILNDDAVSWHHARVQDVNGAVSVVDENSTNGVFVNERRIQPQSPQPLQPGDTLRIGATTFTLQVAAPAIITPVASARPAVLPPLQSVVRQRSGRPIAAIGLILALALLFGAVIINSTANRSASVPIPPTLTRPSASATVPPTIAGQASPDTPTAIGATPTTAVVRATGDVPTRVAATRPPQPTAYPPTNPPATSVPPTAIPPSLPLSGSLRNVLTRIQALGGALDRLYGGSGAEACDALLADFYGVTNAPTYSMNGQPPAVQTAYNAYRQAVNLIATKVNPIRLVCENGGGSLGALDFNVARTAINDANDLLNSAFQALGQ